ncbi:hypothetical protein [uncultured Kordia sp.]|uniref:hypothetical protein n=1 Tax=uncultured Kordia sp. TaxID=507699 RepID=UPI00261C36B8|nr:hypothetical protein [uncultured Kordia sp.]
MKSIKNILLLVLVLLCFINCEKETSLGEFEEIINTAKQVPFSSRLVYTNEIESNRMISEKLRGLNIHRNNANFESDSNDFSIDTNIAKYVEKTDGSGYSYTFAINREGAIAGEVENLVLSINTTTKEISTILIKYHYSTTQFQELLSTGHVSTYNETTVTPVTGNFSSLLTESSTQPCTISINTFHIIPTVNGVQGATYQYTATSQCQHEIDPDTGETECEVYSVLNIWCPPGSSNGSSSTSTTSGTNTNSTPSNDPINNTTNGGSTTPTNSNNNNDENEIVTTPLLTPQQEINNCINLSLQESNWLNLRENNAVALEINNYLQSEGCNETTQNIIHDALILLILDENLTFEKYFVQNMVFFKAPTNPIQDIIEYLNCFDTSAPAELTIFSDQPVPGDREETWTWGGDVGHAYIGITQGNITRILGLYPTENTTPLDPSAPFIYGNDENYNSDISITKDISSSELTNILTEITTNTNNYNLNTNNCATFAIRMANIGGITLPSTESSWPGGEGNNPADLGEDIRESNIIETEVNPITRNAPQNNGNC